MNIKYKIWLEENGEKTFGFGPLQLLKKIEEKGSLRKAAEDMNMSYNKAWTLIKKLEKANGFIFLERHVGGSGGGSSSLTDEVRELMNKYEKFNNRMTEIIKESYNDFF